MRTVQQNFRKSVGIYMYIFYEYEALKLQERATYRSISDAALRREKVYQ